VAVRAHRERERQQHVVGVAGRGIEAEEGRDEVRALGRQGPLGVDDLDHVAFEHRDIREFAVGFGAPVLDHEQAGLNHFHDKTERRDRPRRAPDEQVSPISPDAEVNAGPFDRGRELGEVGGVEGQRPLDEQCGAAGLGREVGERDRRLAAFFAPQARPEGGVDDALDRGGVRDFGLQPRALDVAAEMLLDGGCDRLRGRIG